MNKKDLNPCKLYTLYTLRYTNRNIFKIYNRGNISAYLKDLCLLNIDRNRMLLGIKKEHKQKKSISEGMEHMTMEFSIGIYCDVFIEFYINDDMFVPSWE